MTKNSDAVDIRPYELQPINGSMSATTADIPYNELDEVENVQENQPSMGWMLLRELIETIVLSLIIFLLVRQVIQNYRIESHSMQPTFYEGQFILVNKLAYRLGEPDRGDVVVFHNPSNEAEDYIKRIIGLPGDKLEIYSQQVYINDELLDEPFDKNMFRPDTRYGPIVIEPNHIFVMGDNRPNSSDSRRFGPISQDLLVGQAWLRVWPFSLLEKERRKLKTVN